MGFCYELKGGSRLLCCDNCGTSGGVRKVQCPAGWCQATALCERCRKDPTVKAALKESHETCAAQSARFGAEQAAVEALQAAGEYVFCASSYEDDARTLVRCWFRKTDGEPTKTLVLTTEQREKLTRLSTYSEVCDSGYTGVFVGGVKVAESRRVEA